MNNLTISVRRSFHNSFAHSRVRMHSFNYVHSGTFQFTRNNYFGNHFCNVCAYHVCAQEFAEPRPAVKLTGTDGYFARVGGWLRTAF